MNPLSRFVAMTLFAVLVALVTVLALSAWRESRPAAAVSMAGRATKEDNQTRDRTPAVVLTHRLALGISVVALVLSVALLVGSALRPGRTGDTAGPYHEARHDVTTLAKLAESTVAQSEELSRERDVRRRAEEDGRLKQQLLTESLDEKIRLGRDLHDGIIQSLYAAGLTLESVRALLKSDPAEAERRLDQIRGGLNNAIRDVRTYIQGLAPETLRRAGFARALGNLLGELRAGREAQFDLKVDDDAAALLSPEQSLEVLQIAREAVSNALRHGSANKITLRMHLGDWAVCLLVQDNGSGFDSNRPPARGHGVGNMQARAERIGASLKISSHPGNGTRILATLPVLEPAVR